MQSKTVKNHLLYLLKRVRAAESLSSLDIRNTHLNGALNALLIADVLNCAEFEALGDLALNASECRFNELLPGAV